MLVFGIFDLARLFQSWVAVQHAAREAARYAITGQVDCQDASTREECVTLTAKRMTAGLSGGMPAVSVSYKAWDYDAYAGSGVSGKLGQPCDQIEITVRYTHHFATPILQAIAPSGVGLKGEQRMTNEPFGSCRPDDGVG